MNHQVIIGSNFGDEGKGLTTDYYADKVKHLDSVVVRFNGGSQAFHTVVTPDNRRHVFSHSGSGAYSGVPTFLSRYFIVNPIIFLKENAPTHKVYVDPMCIVSTPFDMLINQAVEIMRGDNKHGSVGVGINETVTRCLLPDFNITVRDLDNTSRLKQKLENIRDIYVPERSTALNLRDIPESIHHILTDSEASDLIIERWLDDVHTFLNSVTVLPLVYRKFEHYIFEGAQGLALDEYHYMFPHVTRSRTGLRNVKILCREVGIDKVDVNYITRSYLTRHGAGPLRHELGHIPYEKVSDPTNTNHQFQGELRYAYLDLDLLIESISNDMDGNKTIIDNARLVVTCMDQTDSVLFAHHNDETLEFGNRAEFVNYLKKLFPGEFLLSYGPTREYIFRG